MTQGAPSYSVFPQALGMPFSHLLPATSCSMGSPPAIIVSLYLLYGRGKAFARRL